MEALAPILHPTLHFALIGFWTVVGLYVALGLAWGLVAACSPRGLK